MEYLIVLVVAVASWILVHRWSQRKAPPQGGPKRWPVIGATVEQAINYNRLHDWLFDYLSKSKTVNIPVVFAPNYTFTADPANVEHILKTKFSNYPKGESFHANFEPLLGDGIFNVDGETWRKQRKTASFEFSNKNLRDFSTVVFRDDCLKLSSILAEASFHCQIIDMKDLLMRMTLDSICKVGFGVELGTLAPDLPENSFVEAFDDANLIMMHRFFDPFWKIKKFLNIGSQSRLDKCIQVIDEFTYSIINRQKSDIHNFDNTHNIQIKHDLLTRFIQMGNDVSDKSLRDTVLNFALAGRDSTAGTLLWAIHMIMSHPHVSDKLYTELKTLDDDDQADEEEIKDTFERKVAGFAGMLTYEALGKLHYLHAVITETLRLYPAVPIDGKGIAEDDVLPDGTRLKAGGMIFYVPYSMGRAEYNWGPDASSFKPERWLKEDGVFRNESPFKFSAFQAGPRVCLGKDSAYLQMKMALAILCRFFEFKLVPGHVVEYQTMVTLSMANGLKVTVSRHI